MIASNPAFVIAAYAITWIVLLGYQLRLVRRHSAARSRHASATGKAAEMQ